MSPIPSISVCILSHLELLLESLENPQLFLSTFNSHFTIPYNIKSYYFLPHFRMLSSFYYYNKDVNKKGKENYKDLTTNFWLALQLSTQCVQRCAKTKRTNDESIMILKAYIYKKNMHQKVK